MEIAGRYARNIPANKVNDIETLQEFGNIL